MGGTDVQIELRKGGSEVVEKARTVESGNLEHGVAIRKGIVDHDLRLDRERSGARVGTALGGDDFADFDLAAQRLFDRAGHAPAASQLVLVTVEGARNEDRVERETVGRRENMGVDDIAARPRAGAGDDREEPGM